MAYSDDYITLTFQHLHYFVRVAELGKMTLAAEELHVTQPLLSQKISQIEKALEVPLFTRIKQRIILTKAGEQFLCDCKEMIRQMDKNVLNLKEINSVQRVHMSIMFSSGQSRSTMRRMVEKIRSSRPDIEIQIHIHSQRKAETKLLSHETDIAVLTDDNEIRYNKNIEYEITHKVPVCCLLGKALYQKLGNKLSWKDLEHYPCFMAKDFKNASLVKDLTQLSEKIGIRLNFQYIDAALITIKNYIAVSDCFTFAYLQKIDADDLILYQIEDFVYPVIVAWQKTLSPESKQQIEGIVACAKDVMLHDVTELSQSTSILKVSE